MTDTEEYLKQLEAANFTSEQVEVLARRDKEIVKEITRLSSLTRELLLTMAPAYFKSLNPDGKSLVDEMIAERREEALKELEE